LPIADCQLKNTEVRYQRVNNTPIGNRQLAIGNGGFR